MTSATETAISAGRKKRRVLTAIGLVCNAALIVTPLLLILSVRAKAGESATSMLSKIAEREAANAKARDNYTYRQVFVLQELKPDGTTMGEYREVRDVTFSPQRGRSERLAEPPKNTLTEVKLTSEDMSDVRNVESGLLTPDRVHNYELRQEGEQTVDGQRCLVVRIWPKQTLAGQRFFDGEHWVRPSDFAILRSAGQAVPQIETMRQQNLTPHFTTVRQVVDGQWLLPAKTVGDDTLQFRDWPVRLRINIEYSRYQRFGSQTTVTYGGEAGDQNARPAPPAAPAAPPTAFQTPAPPPPPPNSPPH